MVITSSKSMDQPGKVANPARGHLNGENDFFPVPVCAWEFGLARRFLPSRPASARSSSTLWWNLVLTPVFLCFLSFFAAKASVFFYRQPPSGLSRSYQVTPGRVPMTFTAESPPGTRPADRPQGSSSNGRVLPIYVTPWTNLMCAFFFPHLLLLVHSSRRVRYEQTVPAACFVYRAKYSLQPGRKKDTRFSMSTPTTKDHVTCLITP